MMSTKVFPCRCCGLPVDPGQEVLPVEAKHSPGFIWAHYTCATRVVLQHEAQLQKMAAAAAAAAASTATATPSAVAPAQSTPQWTTTVCRHWRKRGSCAFGDGCFFAHPEDQRGTPVAQHVHQKLSAARKAKMERKKKLAPPPATSKPAGGAEAALPVGLGSASTVGSSSAGKRRAGSSSNMSRATVLRRFLLERVSIERLQVSQL